MDALLSAGIDAQTRLIVIVVIALILFVRGAMKKSEPRKPGEGPQDPHPSGPPPTVPWPRTAPHPRPTQVERAPVAATRAPRRKLGEPMVLAPPPVPHGARKEEPGSGDAPIAREDAPAADFDASRDLTRRTAAVQGGEASRPVLMKGRALLGAAGLTRRDRLRAAVVWSEILRPPVALRGRDRVVRG